MRISYSKVIDADDFEDASFRRLLKESGGSDLPETERDAGRWQSAMMLRTFIDHGMVEPGATFAGVGAGTDPATFVLAAKGCLVFPADRYLDVTPWTNVAPAAMMVRPEQFSQFPHDRGCVIPVHADPRRLNLPTGYFDGAYSLGTIGRLGSLEAVAAAAEEIGRILRPGGVASIATAFRLEGPNGQPWFDNQYILFTPELIQKHIVRPSGLEMIGELDTRTSKSSFDGRAVLMEFATKTDDARSVQDKQDTLPNLVLFHGGHLFSTVHLALRKPSGSRFVAAGVAANRFAQTVENQVAATAAVLTGQIKMWESDFRRESGRQDAQPRRRVPRALLDDAWRACDQVREEYRQLEVFSMLLLNMLAKANDRGAPAGSGSPDESHKLYRRVAELNDKVGTLGAAFTSLLDLHAESAGITGDAALRALQRDDPGLDLPEIKWVEAFRFRADQLPSAVGAMDEGVLRADGKRAGHVSFGPYVALDPGRYRLVVDLVPSTTREKSAIIEICHSDASAVAMTAKVEAPQFNQPVIAEFALERKTEDAEVRVWVPYNSKLGVLGWRLEKRELNLTNLPVKRPDALVKTDEMILQNLRLANPGLAVPEIEWGEPQHYKANDLRTMIGTRVNGTLHSEGRKGFLSYGPYCTLKTGHYRLVLDMLAPGTTEGIVVVDVCYDNGAIIPVVKKIEATHLGESVTIEFMLNRDAADVEVRVKTYAGMDVVLRSLRIERRMLRVRSKHPVALDVANASRAV